MNTTIDGLLDRRVMLEQPAAGYRVAIDTVLLAAAVPARAEEKILDLGCGAGGALLCLAARVRGVAIIGIEIQDELARLCGDNIARNGLHADLSVRPGDATKLPPLLAGLFDHVMMNPPYHDEARHDVSPQAQKRAANAEKEGDLALWIGAASRALAPSGMLTMIHRADRQQEIAALLERDFGPVEILPLTPKEDAPPRRVIVRAQKGGEPGTARCRALALHRPDGGYTDGAEAVLRHMKALEFAAAS